MINAARHRRAAQCGFTLLEALVTIVIVSIGLLGLLGLQTVSIANTQTSAARSDATAAADNMADRMRANPLAVSANDFDGVSHPANGSAPVACRENTSCTPAQMAAYDAWSWDLSLGKYLPNGRGYIACADTTTNSAGATVCIRYLVTVAWSESNRGTNGDSAGGSIDRCSARTDITDRCFQTTVKP